MYLTEQHGLVASHYIHIVVSVEIAALKCKLDFDIKELKTNFGGALFVVGRQEVLV